MAEGSLLVARRTGGDKFSLLLDDGLAAAVSLELDGMQAELLQAATQRLEASTLSVGSYADMAKQLESANGSSAPGLFLVPWHDDAEAEEQIKKETKATIRCYPLDRQHLAEGQECFFSGKPATHMAIFARAF